jgi:hypothetical protein
VSFCAAGLPSLLRSELRPQGRAKDDSDRLLAFEQKMT